jgi:dihydroorotase
VGTLRIRGGRILDPSIRLDAVGDLVIADGRIASLHAASGVTDEEYDAAGMFVVPGLIDIHVHLRQPGKEAAETVASGGAAALAGGFTTIVAMPNTSPATDRPEVVHQVRQLATEAHGPRVEIAAAITAGRQGREIADLRALAACGIAGFSDDGNGVADPAIMSQCLELARELHLPVFDHAEDSALSAGGVIHGGVVADEVGAPGICAEAETAMVARDIGLCKLTGGPLHIQHVSTAGAVELVRSAKEEGLPVTAEATPHHLTLTEEALRDGNANFKMNPPLRTREDMLAIRRGLKDGTIDCIATDHAPHTVVEKARGLREAPFGVIGLETALPILWTELIRTGEFKEGEIISRLTASPAAIIHSARGTLLPGRPADVAIIDPRHRWIITPERFRSKSRNSPFIGREVFAAIAAVVVEGRLIRHV